MRKYLVVLALPFLSSASYSQSGNRDLGFYLGPNFSNIDIESPELMVKNRAGFQAGAYYRSGGFLFGQVGLEYCKMNSNFAQDSSSGDVTFRQIRVPLYAGFNLFSFSKDVVNVRLYGGPSFSFMLSDPGSGSDYSMSEVDNFGMNATIGAGFDVLIFTLDGGYTMGMSDLFTGDWEGKGNYAFVNVGVKF